MFQNTPYLSLEVGDCFFIVHIENLTGQYLVPMFYHGVILLIIVSNLQHAIRKILAATEELLVTAKTTVEGMPAGIDYFGIGQDQMCETDQGEIIR